MSNFFVFVICSVRYESVLVNCTVSDPIDAFFVDSGNLEFDDNPGGRCASSVGSFRYIWSDVSACVEGGSGFGEKYPLYNRKFMFRRNSCVLLYTISDP